MLNEIFSFIQNHKPYFELAQSLSSILSVIAWLLTLPLLIWALISGRVKSFSVAGAQIHLREEAFDATVRAARDRNRHNGNFVNVPRIRATTEKAFNPTTRDNLAGKSILWVDDNPGNNTLAVRALRKYGLEIEQVLSTDGALATLEQRHFDLIISDMGRGTDMLAGYELLGALRRRGTPVPYFIFSGDDKPQYRREAQERGAQLSTNDMAELVESVITTLGSRP